MCGAMDETMVRLTLAGLLLALPACGDGGGDESNSGGGATPSESGLYQGTFTFDPDPSITGDNTLHAMLSTAEGEAVTDATVSVEPWMPSMGHGSSTTPVVHDMGEGNYHIESLTFTMPGSWEVRIEVDAVQGEDGFVLPREVQ
jgi:hypothetical protein